MADAYDFIGNNAFANGILIVKRVLSKCWSWKT
jgi:hypothetical protein